MKKIAAMLPFAALVLTAGTAFAADTTAGTVSSANPSTGMVNLTDGTHYRVSEPVLLKGLAPGSHVIITLNDDHTVGITGDTSYDSAHDNY